MPADAKIRVHPGGGNFGAFFTTVYAGDYLLVKVQHSADDRSALITSACLTSNHVRLFGPGEDGVTPIQTPKARTDWNTTIDALEFTITSHILRSPCTREDIEAIMQLLFDQWSESRRQAETREVLSMEGKLWNLTCVVRADGYFVWRILLLHPPARLAWPNTPEAHSEP